MNYLYIIQYNTVKLKTSKPNQVDKLKDISSLEFFFSLSLLFLNRNDLWTEVKTADPLRFSLTVLYCILQPLNNFNIWKRFLALSFSKKNSDYLGIWTMAHSSLKLIASLCRLLLQWSLVQVPKQSQIFNNFFLKKSLKDNFIF